jgi:hypothetical protein
MTFPEFLHLITTSRYTRKLEQENFELRQEVKALRRGAAGAAIADEDAAPAMTTLPRRRGGRFTGFSQIKRRLESQEPQHKGA